MKKIIKIISCFIVFSMVSGCTAYKAAVDERRVGTIADDTIIKGKILEKFFEDNKVKPLEISIGCFRGHVYLVGEYDDPVQKVRAMELAKSVEGVKSVTTYLLAKRKNDFCGFDDNLAIEGKVKAKLIADKDIRSTNVAVKSVQCHVVLYGLVGSKAEIDKAVAQAKSVGGTRGVTSLLESAR
jgi:hyperosmotically inducible periplasmic protein